MKHLNRFLAVLLAVLMLCGMFSAVAEMEVALEAPQDVDNIELDTDDALDASLDLDNLDDLDLEDPDLVSEAPEAAVVSNADEALEDNASPFRINRQGVLVKYVGNDSLVVIPKSVVDIKSKAFANNASIRSVVIPETVTTIHAQAFMNCVNLSDVTVLARDINIAGSAFNGETPHFNTVVNSSAAAFATRHGFTVDANLILLNGNYTLRTVPNKIYRIYINNGRAISYASNNTSVATVNDAGIVRTYNGGDAQITVTMADGQIRTLTITVDAPTASLSITSMTMKVGESRTITVNNLSGRSVTWSSSNANVASVNAGRVTARGVGSCTITARLSDGTTLTCRVNVSRKAQPKPQKKASLNKASLDLKVGDSFTLIVNNRGNRSVTWSSNYPNVASVNGGKVIAKKAGSCTITARLSDGTTLTCKVNVSQKSQPQKKPSLNKTSLKLKVGDTATLTINNRGNRSVTWSSNYPNVASVNGGKVTAKGAGNCTITARLSDGTTLTCKVNVTRKSQPQKKPSLNKTKYTMYVGKTFRMYVNNLGNLSVTSWESNNTNIATIDRYGVITAVKAGKCIITARLSNGTILQCNLTVKR